MIRVLVAGLLLALVALPGQSPPDAASTVTALRQSANDLNEAVKKFQIHLDAEIALHDRGYRTPSGKRIPGADADLGDGDGDSAQTAIRKLFAARMMSARRPGYEPAALADADRIQYLIEEARNRINAANDLIHGFFLISASALNSGSDSAQKNTHRDLMKARASATEAAKKALVVLPVALAPADTPQQQRDKAWDPIGPRENTPALPVRLQEGERVTLICDAFRRIALTDSGIEDGHGRRLFYQEEWVRREGTTVVSRWAVAVNSATGQHTMLRRYSLLEFRGDLDEAYGANRTHLLPYTDLTVRDLSEISGSPTVAELAAALAELANSREQLRGSLAAFRREVLQQIARNDARLAAENKLSFDDDLPNDIRETLFAIRGRLAGTAVLVEGERNIHAAVGGATGKVGKLEAEVAWADGALLEEDTPPADFRPMLEIRQRCDTEIDITRSLQLEALAALPPDLSAPEAQFPALRKDLIVRLRRLPAGYRQEVWEMEGSVKGARQVKRTIVLLDIDPATGIQLPVSREVKYYRADAGDSLEEIYDENAANN